MSRRQAAPQIGGVTNRALAGRAARRDSALRRARNNWPGRCARPARMVEIADGGGAAADIVIWTDPRARTEPFGAAVNVVDLHGISDPAVLPTVPRRRAAAGRVGGGARVLVRRRARHARSPSCPTPPRSARARRPAFRTLLIVQGASPGPATLDSVSRAASWAAAKGIACGVADPAGVAGLQAIQAAGAAPPSTPAPSCSMRGRAGSGRRAGPPRRGAGGAARRCSAAARPRCCSASPAAGAGIYADPLEAGLDHLAALPPARLQAMSDAARAFAQRWFDPADAAAALLGALDRAVARTRRRNEAWMRREPGVGPGGHVLVISDEALNLVDIRIHLPFAALHRRGAHRRLHRARGMARWPSAPRRPDAGLRFDTVWVHRSVDTGVQLLLQVARPPLRLRRGRQSARLAQLPRRLPAGDDGDRARAAAALRRPLLRHPHPVPAPAAPQRLAPRRQSGADRPIWRTDTPAPMQPGRPRAVIWASSDQPALTGSRAGGGAGGARLLPGAQAAAWSAWAPSRRRYWPSPGLPIEHPGLLSYPAYLARLRSLSPADPGLPAGDRRRPGDAGLRRRQERREGDRGAALRPGRRVQPRPPLRRKRPRTGDPVRQRLRILARGARARLPALRQPGPAMRWPRHRAADLLGPTPWAEALAGARARPSRSRSARCWPAVHFVRAQQIGAARLAGVLRRGILPRPGTRTCGWRCSRGSSAPATTIIGSPAPPSAAPRGAGRRRRARPARGGRR